tara:strand:- start:118 stop:534 length:417 start_codon:yes stop_codon:yes gene_type:complete
MVVCKRVAYIALVALTIIIVIASITTGGYLMIKDLDRYKCGHINIGIIVYVSSLIIFILSIILKHNVFIFCLNTLLIGDLGLIGSLVTNGYLMFMLGYHNDECLTYYKENKEGDYYFVLMGTNVILVILVSLYLICIK